MPNQFRSERNQCQGTKLIKLRRFTKRRNRSTLQAFLSGNLTFNRRAWPEGLCPPLSRHLARLGTLSLSVLNLRCCLGWHLSDSWGTEENGSFWAAVTPFRSCFAQNYAGLLRWIRNLRPRHCFSENHKLSTCGFAGVQFVVVGDWRFIVVIRHSFGKVVNRWQLLCCYRRDLPPIFETFPQQFALRTARLRSQRPLRYT